MNTKELINNDFKELSLKKNDVLGNNGSERGIRNVKVKTKVFGQFRNCEGKCVERFAGIRSVIDTTVKNSQDVFFALKCIANIHITNSTLVVTNQ